MFGIGMPELLLLLAIALIVISIALSFAAVLLLLWFARRHVAVSARSWFARLSGGAVQLAVVQVFLLFGLMPLVVANFGRVSFVAPAVRKEVHLVTAPHRQFIIGFILYD